MRIRDSFRTRLTLVAHLTILSAIGATPASAQTQQAPAALAQFLGQSIGLDAAQLALVERGDAVVKVLETQNKRDVAVFGIIIANASRDSYVRRLRDFRQSLRSPARTLFGIFSDP